MNKSLRLIMPLIMFVFIGFGMIIPVVPAIVAGRGNANLHLALFLSLYSAASFLMSPVWGALSDRIGRKPVIMAGLLGFCISFLLFGFANGQLWMMYVSRITGGLFSGAVMSCAMAYVADVTTSETRTKGMGLIGMSIGLGFLFGPPFGGILSKAGLNTPFFVSAAVVFLMFLYALSRLPESLPESERGQVREKTSRWKAFAGTMKFLYILSFFVTFTLSGLETTFQVFEMKKIGATPDLVGYMFLISGVVGAVIQGGVVRRIPKGRETGAIVGGLILSACGFALIPWSAGFWTASVFMSVFGAGNALVRPCVLSLITQKTTVGQGVATGLNSSMDSLGRIAGPLFAMGVYSLNINGPFLAGALLCLAAIGLVLAFREKDSDVPGMKAAGHS